MQRHQIRVMTSRTRNKFVQSIYSLELKVYFYFIALFFYQCPFQIKKRQFRCRLLQLKYCNSRQCFSTQLSTHCTALNYALLQYQCHKDQTQSEKVGRELKNVSSHFYSCFLPTEKLNNTMSMQHTVTSSKLLDITEHIARLSVVIEKVRSAKLICRCFEPSQPVGSLAMHLA